jgi:hypothetical protein
VNYLATLLFARNKPVEAEQEFNGAIQKAVKTLGNVYVPFDSRLALFYLRRHHLQLIS